MDLLDDDSVIDLRPRGRRTDPAAFIDEQRRRRAPVPAENEALRSWQDRPAPQPASDAELGPCAACQVRPARSRCPQCGLAVCAADRWTMLGLCKTCVAAKGA